MSQINFNSCDWGSIKDTIDKVNEVGEVQLGKTDDGEDILFYVIKDEDGHDKLKTEVFQSNGWIRTNIYDPNDWTIEELYKKE